jgi:hypothetical protein
MGVVRARAGVAAFSCGALILLGCSQGPTAPVTTGAMASGAGTASAAPAGATTPTAAPGTTAAARAASRIVIDPATGEPRLPTPAELAELTRREAADRAVAQKAAPPAAATEFQLPDGTVGVRFPENASQPLIACRRLDGQVDEHCHLPSLPPGMPAGVRRETAR